MPGDEKHINGSADKYLCHTKHHGRRTREISTWDLTPIEETDCFMRGYNLLNKELLITDTCWSFDKETDKLKVLGGNTKYSEIKIAKFVSQEMHNYILWHGYPADHINKAKDRVPENILGFWKDKGEITKREMNNIRRRRDV